MGNYDDFDLDVKSIKGQDMETRGSSKPCSWIAEQVTGSIVTGCTGGCISTKCSKKCQPGTKATCVGACGSYTRTC